MTTVTRTKLLDDAEYFSRELLKRLAALEQIEGVGKYRSHWQTLAGRTRRTRGYVRDHQNREARVRKHEARVAAIRAGVR